MEIYRVGRGLLGLLKRYMQYGKGGLGRWRSLDPVCPSVDRIFRGLILECWDRDPQIKLVQVGAHTGVGKHDVLDLIQRHSISSVLVEPQPDVYAELKENCKDMPSVVTKNIAVSSENGTQAIYRLNPLADRWHPDGAAYGKSLGSFDREHLLSYFRRTCKAEGRSVDESELIDSVDVVCATVKSLLEEVNLDDVDILLVDTEGYDFEVLKMFFNTGCSPKLIRYEHSHLGQDQSLAWDMLIGLGYRLILDRPNHETVAIFDGG